MTTSRLKILLAEDDKTNAILASAILESSGHEAMVAADGEKAVLLATRHWFDLILMDLEMPVFDGLEATRRIRAAPPPARDIPIIGLSAHDDPAIERQCLAAGMNAYVCKPLSRASLLEALDKAVRAAARRRSM
ncbi:response regulator [Neomegalonema perideroedes]|uniref:response regulator n=1 Tax=Neomegalonema perideroedes TaxID=217219 RepID=UPI0003AB14CD|nr:response regulator [Neomegalonema perideroedes]